MLGKIISFFHQHFWCRHKNIVEYDLDGNLYFYESCADCGLVFHKG